MISACGDDELDEEFSGIRCPDSPGHIPGSDLHSFGKERLKIATLLRGPRRLVRRLTRSGIAGDCRSHERGTAPSVRNVFFGGWLAQCPPQIF